MSEMLLVRHGQTEWNRLGRLQGREDIPLNELGWAQARAAADTLADEVEQARRPDPAGAVDWCRIVTSPLSRARDTATVLSDRLGLAPPQTADDLVERSFGIAAGLDAEEYRRLRAHTDVGLEPRSAVWARVAPVLTALVLADGGPVVVITHGSVITTVLRALSHGAVPQPGLNMGNLSASLVHPEAELPPVGWRIGYHNRDLTVAGRAVGPPT